MWTTRQRWVRMESRRELVVAGSNLDAYDQDLKMALPAPAAVPIALAAAACFGGAAYLQHAAAQQAPPRGPLRPRLIWDLLHNRRFRWSIGLSALAFVLQVWALSIAALALVQPLLISQLICYLLLVSIHLHQTPDPGMLVGAGIAACGIVCFLLVSRPAPTPPGAQLNGQAALVCAAVLAAVVIASLLLATRLRAEWRAVPLATACAVCYGVTATLVRSLTSSGWPELVTRWELYAVIVIAPVGFMLNQNAFQNGIVGSVAVATITVGDPAVSVVAGAVWLGETLAVGPGWSTGQAVALLAVVTGILVLAHRAQLVVTGAVGEGRAKGQQPAG